MLRLALGLIASVLLLFFIFALFWLSVVREGMQFSVPVDEYYDAEFFPSELMSRTWMVFAIETQKRLNQSPSEASRLFAYTASVFSDTLEETEEVEEASAATALFLTAFLPPVFHNEIYSLHYSLFGSTPSLRSAKATQVLAEYLLRSHTDGSLNKLAPSTIPESKFTWHGDALPDTGAASGSWKRWILPDDIEISVPPPPVPESIADRVEMELVYLATDIRKPSQIPIISFWHAASGYTKATSRSNITPAGLWQNILFIELGSTLDEISYARTQKLLAQSIADSFIATWNIKYKYLTQRPSMRMPELSIAMANPPFPSYISGHSTISKTAAVVLSYLHPEKLERWHALARDARTSRLLAGIHYDIDNSIGEVVGERIGRLLGTQLGLDDEVGMFRPYPQQSLFVNGLKLSILKTYNTIRKIPTLQYFRTPQAFFTDLRFSNSEDLVGLKIPGTNYAVWFDLNGDEEPDLFAGGRIYQNQKGNFIDVTESTGLSKVLMNEISNAAAVDIDGNSCPELLLLHAKPDVTRPFVQVFKNDCEGSFSDVTEQFRIPSSHATGIAVADYDHDGFIDLYVANWPSEEHQFDPEPNLLLKGTSDSFVDVTANAGVLGKPFCPNYPEDRFHFSKTKNSYQPTWLDYDQDGYLDLFVATDTWISPLYRNEGNGTFSDVTYEAGLCVPGTGMGVTIADIDGNGYEDIYVSNIGSNYLWMNNGNGTFTEEADKRGVSHEGEGWGVLFADFDNDEDDDLYVVNGVIDNPSKNISPDIDWRGLDAVYENIGNGYFIDVTSRVGISGNNFKQTLAASDYNRDGKLDLFIGWVHPQPAVTSALYKNESLSSNNWIGVSLSRYSSAVQSNTIVEVSTAQRTQRKRGGVHVSFMSQHDSVLHFGLGKAERVSLKVIFPDGDSRNYDYVDVNRIIEIE